MKAERPIFGDSESIKEAGTKPRTKKPKKEEVRKTEFDAIRGLPDIETVLKRIGERRKKIKEKGLGWNDYLKEGLGEQRETVRPSIVSQCLRWWGYEVLGETLKISPEPESVDSVVMMGFGSGFHEKIESTLSIMGQTEYRVSGFVEDMYLSGIIDLLRENMNLPPDIGQYQVFEFKTVTDWAFNKVLKREGLRKSLVPTQEIVAPRESDEIQVSLYMYLLAQEGKKPVNANILYFNRNSGERKEALVLWDETTKFRVNNFIEEMKQAHDLIAQGQLPEPTTESRIPCGYYCPYRAHCEYAKVPSGKRRKPRRPEWVIKKTKEKRAKLRRTMEEEGKVQPTLGGDFDKDELVRR